MNISDDLPLIDLHRHLEGNVRLETVLDLGLMHGVPLPVRNLAGLRPYVQVSGPQPGLLAFFEKFAWISSVLADYRACYRVALENVEDAHGEGIDYLELRFSPCFMAERWKLDPAGVVEAVAAGAADGSARTGMRVNLIGIISRTYGPEAGRRELEALLSHRDRIVALDLAGDEINYPAVLFADHFRQARDAGWQITVHAGEAAGPASIWQALNELHAVRIGHATSALGDPALIDHLVEHHIGVEVSLTSNVQISAVPDYAGHPLKQMLEKGVLATINTDDPGISGIDLRHEYAIAAPAAGLTAEQIRRLQANALVLAFLSPREKAELAERRRRLPGQTVS